VSTSTRDRLLAEAMRLFGERGYASTSVADIESAAGLKPGSGGLYRHFSSKRAVLDAGIREKLDSPSQLMDYLSAPASVGTLPLREQLAAIAHAALVRLDDEQALNRIILRDLRDFPELASLVRMKEIKRIQDVLAAWLRSVSQDSPESIDWNALAAVLMGSISHYWVLRDSLGEHPSLADEDRYIDTLVDLVIARMQPTT
jgi:AcrR family transcriptional regulator